jgi:arsenical pump membrane protein
MVSETGLVDRVAARLARMARGNGTVLYLLVCLLCAALTAVISLDGAVVLMVPLVLVLHKRYQVPLAPSLLGVVAVANTSSIALPQGNPTNLVVIAHLHLSAAAFIAHMFVPGVFAAALCAVILWIVERPRLNQRYERPDASFGPLTTEQRRGATALAAAAIAAWVAPFVGIQPWWPFMAIVAIAVLATRSVRSIAVPWRIAVQIAGLVIVVVALGLTPPSTDQISIPVLLAISFGTGAIAAAINNLPASVWASTLLSAGPVAYGATIGLAVGALAAPQGSVATLIAADLAGSDAPAMTARRLAPLAIAATVAATLLLRLML